MKIFIVLEYLKKECKVMDVYFDKYAADIRCKRLGLKAQSTQTYHVIRKSVRDLKGFDIYGVRL